MTMVEVEMCRVTNSIALTKLEIDQREKRNRDTRETQASRESIEAKKLEIQALLEEAKQREQDE